VSQPPGPLKPVSNEDFNKPKFKISIASAKGFAGEKRTTNYG